MATVSYNGVTLEKPRIESLRFQPVFDEEDRVLQHVDVTLVALGWYFQTVGGSGQDVSVQAKQLSISNMLGKLSMPRGNFFWWERGGETYPMLEIRPGSFSSNIPTASSTLTKTNATSFLRALGRDVYWGPKVIAEVVDNLPGCFLIRLVLTARVNPRIVSGIGEERRTGSKVGTQIISHTSSVLYSIDQNHYTTRQVSGKITYRADIDTDADLYRGDVYNGALANVAAGGLIQLAGAAVEANSGSSQFFQSGQNFTQGIPLPLKFIRERASYNIGPQRNVLNYLVVDREVYSTPPFPATRASVQLEITAANMSSLSFEKRLTGVIEGNSRTTKAELLTVVLELLQRHILTVHMVFVHRSKMIDFLYENRVAFDFQCIQSPGLAYATFEDAGIFIRPPNDAQIHYAQGLRGTAGLQGSGYNLQSGHRGSGFALPQGLLADAQARLEAQQRKMAEEFDRKNRELDPSKLEPGTIDMQERVTLRYVERGNTNRKTNKRAADGTVQDESTHTTKDFLGDLYITVAGYKIAMADIDGNPPSAPNPKKIWRDNDAARVTTANVNPEGKVLLSGRVLRHNTKPGTKLRSKLGGRDLYEIRWTYIVRLEPKVVKKLMLSYEASGKKGELLAGWTYPKQTGVGLKEELSKITWSPDDTPEDATPD